MYGQGLGLNQGLGIYGSSLVNGYPIVPPFSYPGDNFNGLNRGFSGRSALNGEYCGLNSALEYGLDEYGRPVVSLRGYDLPTGVANQALFSAQKGIRGLAYGVNHGLFGRADGLLGNRFTPYGITYKK